MRKLSLIILAAACLLLNLSAAQTVVVTDFTIAKGNSVPFIKKFENQWNNELEFAVYGWIKVPSWVNSEIQVFRLSANKDINSNTLGDRVLKSFVQDNKVMYETYDSKNYDPKVQHSYLTQGDDFGKWYYVYQGYNPTTKKTFGWVQNAAGAGKGGYSNQLATHTTSNFYQVIVGPNSGVSGGDQVYVKILWIQGGAGAYRENNFDTRDTNVVPTPNPPTVNCATVYSECNYQGISNSYCDNNSSITIPKMKSVVIPSGISQVTFYNQESFKGKTIIFKKTVACLDNVDFSLLEQQGFIKIIDENLPKRHRLRNNKKFN